MVKVLISGAAGFLGSHLVDKFLQCGDIVWGLDNLVTGSMENLGYASRHQKFQFSLTDVIEDIADDIPSVDAILHFACPASPIDYLAHPEETLKVDSIGTLKLLERARKDKSRFILASTSEVYGDATIHPQTEDYWGHVNPVGLRSVYDEAKRFSEAAAMSFYRHDHVNVRIVRIFNTYGPRMRTYDGRVVPNFLRQAIRGENITVYGNGSQTRSFCYVDDLVEAIYRITTKEDISHRIVNVGNPDEYSILEFAQKVIRLTNSHSKITFLPLPSDDPRQRRPDISIARQELGWNPETGLDAGLTAMIKHMTSIDENYQRL